MSSESEGAATTTRRKSGRVRKSIDRLDPSSKKTRAGKQNRTSSRNPKDADDDDEEDVDSPDDDDQDEDVDELSPSEDETEEDDDDDDFRAPTRSAAAGKKRKSAPGASKGASQKKKVKGSSPAAGRKGSGQPRKPRARKTKAANGDDLDEADGATKKATSAKDFPIEDDNELFNAVKSPNTALQTTAEDWIESYKEDSGPAMAELVNFVLRCCGCNASVDEHQAEDENGIVENLKDIVDEFKQGSDHAYPLISRSKGFKKFRSSLGQFLQKLLSSASEDVLFSTPFWEQFQAWTHALSSSQIRALRHTATVIVLLSIDALTVLEAKIRKEHSQAMRAKEAEEKKNRKDKSRLRDMGKQVQEIHERLEAVEAFEEEAYTSVFVNRYRDADYVIRAECIAALGNWMKLNPDHWIDGDYLRYIGWVLSDESKEARRDSVRALSSLYDKDNYIGKLHHFTDRFKGQLVDMAMGEHDLAVRVQAIQVVRQIEGHGLLDEDQRDKVAQLVFEKEKKVRNAAAELFKGIVDEEFEQRKPELDAETKTTKGKKAGGRKAKEEDAELETQLEIKIVAELLVKFGKALDGTDGVIGDEEEDVNDSTGRSKGHGNGDSLSDLVDAQVHRSRIALAAEALWDNVESLQDWDSILSFLQRDHSPDASDGKANGKKKGPNQKEKRRAYEANNDDLKDGGQEDDEGGEVAAALPDSIKLTEEEESLTIELLVACLERVTQTSSTSKKDKEQEEEEQAAIARAVIDALPRLFAKHQTFPARMADILAIPRLIQLDLYRNDKTAYGTLWDDVRKQFLKNTDVDVLDQAARTIAHFLGAADLSIQNDGRFAELEDSLLTALRDCVDDKDVESATFDEDQVHNLTACVARLAKLSRIRCITSIKDTDRGTQLSGWEILHSVTNRGRLGYKEEADMIVNALSVIGLHVSWQVQTVALESRDSGAVDASALNSVVSDRNVVLEKCEEFALGNETNAVEAVKEVALTVLLDLHFASAAITSGHNDPDKHLAALRLECGEELQARCAGYVEAEIERFAERIAEDLEADREDDDAEEDAPSSGSSSSGSDTEMEENAKRNKKKEKTNAKGKGKKVAKGKNADKRKERTPASIRAENTRQELRLIASQRFERTISGFTRAVHLGIFDIRHSSLLLKYWGRLGPTFDDFARLLMHDLRDEGNYGDGGNVVASVVVDTLKGALEIYLDSSDSSDEHLVSLGRSILQSVVVRGAQLSVVSTIPAENHLQINLDSLDYIVKKIKQFNTTKRAEDRSRAMSFFKPLSQLVFGLDGRSSLKAKTAFDSLLEKNEVEVPVTSKSWEPLRSYQKRLVTNMAKDPAIKSRAQAQAKSTPKKTPTKGKSKAKAKQSDDEQEFDGEEEDEAEPRDEDRSTPLARSSPVRKSSRGQKRQTPDYAEQSDAEADTEERSKRIRTDEPAEPSDEAVVGESGATNGARPGQSVQGSGRDSLGDLDNTPADNDGEPEREDVEDEDEERSVREGSADSVMSLSDLKRKRRRRK